MTTFTEKINGLFKEDLEEDSKKLLNYFQLLTQKYIYEVKDIVTLKIWLNPARGMKLALIGSSETHYHTNNFKETDNILFPASPKPYCHKLIKKCLEQADCDYTKVEPELNKEKVGPETDVYTITFKLKK